MTRLEFLDLLTKNGIDTSIVSFNDSTKDGYCIRKNHYRWEVLNRERGIEYEVMGYPSESDALICLFNRLIIIYGKEQAQNINT